VSASFTLQNDNRLTAVVPAGATTGRISVTTSAGTGTSSSNFTVVGGGTHARQVFLNLSGRLIASGRVIANDGYQPCVSFVPVAIKRLRFGEWRWVTTTSTRQDGTYRAFIRNRTGTYRAKAKRVTLANGAICGGDRSNTEFYRR
jgi:hypothetical protein